MIYYIRNRTTFIPGKEPFGTPIRSQQKAFGMLLHAMVGQVIPDKTERWVRKSIFHDQPTVKLKILVGVEYLCFYLSGDKNSDLFKKQLYEN